MRLLDRRLLAWLLLLVFATGLPLLGWFDEDPDRHAAALPAVGLVLRGMHAVASAGLVLGTVWHLVARLRSATRPTRRAVRSGGLALVAVGLAAWTGALADQTGHGDRALELLGLDGGSVAAVAVVHAAVASLLVALTVYIHLARKARAVWLGSWRHGVFAALLVVAGVLLVPGVGPGADAGHPATVALAPWGVAWPLALGLGVALLAGRLAGRA